MRCKRGCLGEVPEQSSLFYRLDFFHEEEVLELALQFLAVEDGHMKGRTEPYPAIDVEFDIRGRQPDNSALNGHLAVRRHPVFDGYLDVTVALGL